ncbi:MAG: FAD/NAD(P)-binding protein [Patescibacteria group bacterium]|jgi:NAD(P)H-flavin reductase
MNNTYQPQKVKAISVSRQSIDTVMFRFQFVDKSLQRTFAYLPGQFMQIGFPGWGECPISLCSSPAESKKYFELAIRDAGQLTRKINELKSGDEAWVRGPFGNGFDADIYKGKELILIGGGCGFVPLRPIIMEVLAGRIKTKSLKIFYGCLNEDTLLFKKQYPEWNRGAELGVILDKPSAQWHGEKGLITDLIKKRQISPQSVVVMVGPPVMYRFAIKELEAKKVKAQNIWLSLERRMYCGVGVCQHCAVGPYYVCKDGPVFSYAQLKDIPNAL